MKTHITVLRDEAVDALRLADDAVVIDATFGAGGHSTRIAQMLGKKGMLVALDADQDALTSGAALLKQAAPTVHLVTGNFRTLRTHIVPLHIEKVDAILADLGWRMEQFSGNGRGFSFQVDEPLIMTFGDPKTYPFIARDIVNEWKEEDIANVLKGYGEERYARRIARGIVTAREKQAIETTTELASVIEQSVPPQYRRGRIHPATKTFQALRVAVNDELDALSEFITEAIELLSDGGRLVIITFHSIEDRIVKQLFRSYARDQKGTVVTKKPIVPTDDEVRENKRARSAKMRIFEKHANKS